MPARPKPITTRDVDEHSLRAESLAKILAHELERDRPGEFDHSHAVTAARGIVDDLEILKSDLFLYEHAKHLSRVSPAAYIKLAGTIRLLHQHIEGLKLYARGK